MAHKALQKWRGDPSEFSGMTLEDVCGIVARIKAPLNRELFIFQENGLFGAIFYHLILFNPVTNSVTKTPPAIYGKWMVQDGYWGAKFLEPLITFEDIDQEGEPVIVVPEKVHNGTMYNADIYHYFRVGSDMSLHRILALETNLVDLYTEESSGLIMRMVTKLAPNRLNLKQSLK